MALRVEIEFNRYDPPAGTMRVGPGAALSGPLVAEPVVFDGWVGLLASLQALTEGRVGR